jgi:hypothetical protein
MANERLNIPQTLKVGFNERGDTYTGKLAYVTYVNAKGEIAKQLSWDGWRNKNIDAETYDNEPMEGFVLNRHAGGYKSGWNFRQSKCRVYDPRGFEFEITIENLLFILQECTSTKGKGLEGKFVYAWSGPDLVLLPVDSEDYRASSELINKKEKISIKGLKIGAAYKGKEDDYLIYIGKLEWYTWNGYSSGDGKGYYKEVDRILIPTFVSTAKGEFRAYKNMDYIDFIIEENVLTPDEIEMYIDNFKSTAAYKAKFVNKLTLVNSLSEWEAYKDGNRKTYYWEALLFMQRPGEDYITEYRADVRKVYQGLEKNEWIRTYFPYPTFTKEEREQANKTFEENCTKTYKFHKNKIIRFEDGKLTENSLYNRYYSNEVTFTDEDWKYISDGNKIYFTSTENDTDKIEYWFDYHNSKSKMQVKFNSEYPLPE